VVADNQRRVAGGGGMGETTDSGFLRYNFPFCRLH